MSGIIDGRRWLEARLRHLQAELDTDPPPERRSAIEQEMATIRAEVGATRRRWRRFLIFGGHLPG
jgi:hypothetical protein